MHFESSIAIAVQTTAVEEEAHHVELASQDEVAALSKGEPMILLKRFFARVHSASMPLVAEDATMRRPGG